jgi:D-alanyl-D-alanine carboxypeptidase/D-alanyl-D-alanine-endopeptidase (penicillin-binding protein 4)
MKIGDSLKFCHKPLVLSLLTISVAVFLWVSTGFGAPGPEAVTSLVGVQDSILVVDPQGSIIIAKNDGKKLIPASILKIFTSLVAFHYLGPDHRYRTEFFIDNHSNLKI